MENQPNIDECIAEMRCFVRGDLPGIERLKQVYKNIFLHYRISSEEDIRLVVKSLGLKEDGFMMVR
jgi:hypothetical protein